EKNIHAIGATVLVCSDSGLIKYEKYPVRGFQSSMEQYLHIGLGKLRPDSILLVWPDQTYSKLDTANLNSKKAVVYSSGLPRFDYTSHSLPSTQLLVSDVSEKHGVTQVH